MEYAIASMNLKAPVTLLVAFALRADIHCDGRAQTVEIKWSESSSTIRGRTIQLTLPEGATVSGEVIV